MGKRRAHRAGRRQATSTVKAEHSGRKRFGMPPGKRPKSKPVTMPPGHTPFGWMHAMDQADRAQLLPGTAAGPSHQSGREIRKHYRR
jgi:hypothetical protein